MHLIKFSIFSKHGPVCFFLETECKIYFREIRVIVKIFIIEIIGESIPIGSEINVQFNAMSDEIR